MKKPIVLMTLFFGSLICISKTGAMVTKAATFEGLNTAQGLFSGKGGATVWDPRPREEDSQEEDGQEPSPDHIQVR